MRSFLPLVLVGCAPILEDTTPYITAPRIVAASVEPAEVSQGEPVTIRSLVVGPEGEIDPGVDWAFCNARKPLAELGPVSQECLDPTSGALIPVAETGVLPDDACSLFGPNPPPPSSDFGGTLGGRPTDPDITGGYYQPAVGFLDGAATLVSARVRCGLANVDQDTFVAWNLAYVSNVNPVVDSLVVGSADGVGAGESVDLTVTWPDCESGCGGAEAYVVWDPDAKELVDRREAISATWFATGGTFDVARNGRTGDDPATDLVNGWTAPEAARDVWVGVVLRDERGGVGFAGVTIQVE